MTEIKKLLGSSEEIKLFLKFYKFVILGFMILNFWLGFNFGSVLVSLNSVNYLFFFLIVSLLERLIESIGDKVNMVKNLFGGLE